MEKENVVPENKSPDSLLDKAAAAVPKHDKDKRAKTADKSADKPNATNSFDS